MHTRKSTNSTPHKQRGHKRARQRVRDPHLGEATQRKPAVEEITLTLMLSDPHLGVKGPPGERSEVASVLEGESQLNLIPPGACRSRVRACQRGESSELNMKQTVLHRLFLPKYVT